MKQKQNNTNIKTICLASNDVASIFKDLRKVLEENGYHVISYVDPLPGKGGIIQQDRYTYWRDRFFPKWIFSFLDWKYIREKTPWAINKHLYKLRDWVKGTAQQFQLKKIVRKTDLFIFLYNSFEEDCSDLSWIKSKGKKIVYIFVGDDARWYHGVKQDFEKTGLASFSYGDQYDYSVKGLEHRVRKIRQAEKYADLICSKREQSQLQFRSFMHYPMIADIRNYTPIYQQRKERPIVVHAPTNAQTKGSVHVLNAFQRLKEEGVDFEPVLIQNIKHEEALASYRNADIVIDQLYVPGGGKLSTEAMSLGKVAMSRMAYDRYDQGFPIHDCPIVDIGPETIYDELKSLILDHARREQLAKAGRIYVEKYLDIRLFTKSLLEYLETGNMKYVYQPFFFREHYIPESPEAAQCLNHWTSLVKNEDWYQQNVPSGERDGLIF